MRRLTPYALLAILILGAGLGMGLGLSEAPVTYVARPATALPAAPHHWVACSAATDQAYESCIAIAGRRVPGPRVITVPYVIGYGLAEAMAKLVGKNLDVVARNSGGPGGITVVSEQPAAGSRVARGSTVTLSIACGPGTAPNSHGMVVIKACGIDGVG